MNDVDVDIEAWMQLIVIRTHPLPATQPPTSTALAELTLAHRRLSTKLDLTEQALKSAQLELASCTQENTRLGKEREGDRAIINELRRGEEERMEELEWERGERRKAEELKRLWCVPSFTRSPTSRFDGTLYWQTVNTKHDKRRAIVVRAMAMN